MNMQAFTTVTTATIQQLQALGYSDTDTVYYRAIGPSTQKIEGTGFRIPNELTSLNPDRGIYFVVNGGGQSDKDVTHGRAVFYEHDDLSKELQLGLWMTLGLPEPTIQIDTGGKSIHSYWVFETPIDIATWKTLQADLLEYADADRSIKNPSRVMRLAGFRHQKTGETSTIVSNSGRRYSLEELRSVIPVQQPKTTQAPKPSTPIARNSGDIPLEKCVSIVNRQALDGVSEGGRDNAMSALAMDLVGTEQHLRAIGQRFEGDALQLLESACGRCNPPLTDKDVDRIWRSAESTSDGPCLSEDKIKTCIEAWYRKDAPQRVTPIQPQQSDHIESNDSPPKWDGLEAIGGQLCEISWSKKKGELVTPKLDLDFSVSRIIYGSDGGGLMLQIRRMAGAQLIEKELYVKSSETIAPKDFINALQRGIGPVYSTIKPEQLAGTLKNKTDQYYLGGGLSYKLAPTIGRQEDGTWVFENIQYSDEGTVTTPENSGWLFNPELLENGLYPSPQFTEHDSDSIKNLVTSCRSFFGSENLPQVWGLGGYIAATMHREDVLRDFKEFPQADISGEAQAGKTMGVEAMMSLLNLKGCKLGQGTSASGLAEHCTRYSGLPVFLDDPIPLDASADDLKKVRSIVMGQFQRNQNGSKRATRNGGQEPKTNLIVTSNIGFAGASSAADSRLHQFNFVVSPVNVSAGFELERAKEAASGGFPQLLGIQYNRLRIEEIRSQLLAAAPGTDARSVTGLAIVTHFTEEFCRVAGITDFDAFAYTRDVRLAAISDSMSSSNSLEDFLEKVDSLMEGGKLGAWAVSPFRDRASGTDFLAIKISDVFPIVQKHYNVNYNLKTLRDLFKKAGGDSNRTVKMVATELEWVGYQKALADFNRSNSPGYDRPVSPDASKPKKCACIPMSHPSAACFSGQLTAEDVVSTHSMPVAVFNLGDAVIAIEDTLTDGMIAVKQGDRLVITNTTPSANGLWHTVLKADNLNAIPIGVWPQSLRLETEHDRLGYWGRTA